MRFCLVRFGLVAIITAQVLLLFTGTGIIIPKPLYGIHILKCKRPFNFCHRIDDVVVFVVFVVVVIGIVMWNVLKKTGLFRFDSNRIRTKNAHSFVIEIVFHIRCYYVNQLENFNACGLLASKMP